MNTTQKATYLRIALALQNITVHQIIAEQIVETFDAINEKGKEFNLEDGVKIAMKYERLSKEEKP